MELRKIQSKETTIYRNQLRWNPTSEEASKLEATHAYISGMWYPVASCQVEEETDRLFLTGGSDFHGDTKVRHYASALASAKDEAYLPSDLFLFQKEHGYKTLTI